MRTNKVRRESCQDSEDYELEGYLQAVTIQGVGAAIICIWTYIVPPALKGTTTTRSPEIQRQVDWTKG